MATSRSRLLAYLGSTANVVGSGLALVALVVATLTDLVGDWWPAAVGGVYLLGALIGRLAFGRGRDDPSPAARPRRAA